MTRLSKQDFGYRFYKRPWFEAASLRVLAMKAGGIALMTIGGLLFLSSSLCRTT
jgi:hypothetical protein